MTTPYRSTGAGAPVSAPSSHDSYIRTEPPAGGSGCSGYAGLAPRSGSRDFLAAADSFREPGNAPPGTGHAQIIHVRTNDPQRLARLYGCLDQSYVQLSRGAFRADVEIFQAGEVSIFREQLNQAVEVRAKVLQDSYGLFQPVPTSDHATFAGHPVGEGHVLTAKPGGDLWWVSPRNADGVGIVCSAEMLNEFASRQSPTLRKALAAMTPILRRQPEMIQRIRDFCLAALAQARENPELMQAPQALAAVRQEAMTLLLDVAAEGVEPARRGRPRETYASLLRRARDIILAEPDAVLSVTELCARLGADRRALHYAFEHALGVNPSTYLRCLRLDGARRDLLAADPATCKIGDIAARWGFWHPSAFSQHYRSMFGELPSAQIGKGRYG